MAVNVVGLSETNGTTGSPTTTDTISNLNFGSVDAPNLVTASHKVIIGTNSYMKWIRFQLITNNNTSDSAIRTAMTSGSYVTGEIIGSNIFTVVDNGLVTTYGHATAIHGAGAISPMPYAGDGTQMFPQATKNFPVPTSTPGSENIWIGGAAGGSLTTNGTYSNYFTPQNTSTSSTPAGAANTKTFTFTYNEI